MNATKEKVVFVLFVGTKKKKQTKKKDKKRREKKDLSEPLFALFCRPIIDFKKTNFTIIIIILRKTSIFSNAHTHIYIVSLFSLLIREW